VDAEAAESEEEVAEALGQAQRPRPDLAERSRFVTDLPPPAPQPSSQGWRSGREPPVHLDVVLPSPQSVTGVELTVSQCKPGEAHHIVYAVPTGAEGEHDPESEAFRVAEVQGEMSDGMVLRLDFTQPTSPAVRMVRVATVESPCTVDWGRVRVWGDPDEAPVDPEEEPMRFREVAQRIAEEQAKADAADLAAEVATQRGGEGSLGDAIVAKHAPRAPASAEERRRHRAGRRHVRHMRRTAEAAPDMTSFVELAVRFDPKDINKGSLAKQMTDDLIHGLTQMLTNMVTEEFTAELTPKLHEALAEPIRNQVDGFLTDRLTESVGKAVREATAEAVPHALDHILPSFVVMRMVKGMTNTLTRALTHTLTPTLVHTLSWSPFEQYYCYYCQRKGQFCQYCVHSPKEMEYTVRYADYYVDYYSDYYSDMFTKDPEKTPKP